MPVKKAGTQSLGDYIYRWQEKVTEWVALNPILEVCDKETGYEGGGRLREPWWRETAARKQLSDTLKEILEAARDRRWKSSRHGGGRGDRNAAEPEDGAGRNGSWDAGTEIDDDQVGEWSCVVARRRERGRGTVRCGHPPPPGGKKAEDGEGRSGLRRVVAYVTINTGS